MACSFVKGLPLEEKKFGICRPWQAMVKYTCKCAYCSKRSIYSIDTLNIYNLNFFLVEGLNLKATNDIVTTDDTFHPPPTTLPVTTWGLYQQGFKIIFLDALPSPDLKMLVTDSSFSPSLYPECTAWDIELQLCLFVCLYLVCPLLSPYPLPVHPV